MPTKPYEVQNLDVYRRTINLCTRLYTKTSKQPGDSPAPGAVEQKIKEEALALTLNLASGLGFWEKEWKAHHFLLCKTACMNLISLVELWKALGGIDDTEYRQFMDELGDLQRVVGGLLRQVKRRDAE